MSGTRLPNAFSLDARLPDQEIAAWIRAHGHDFGILSETVNDLWCLSACDHLVHFRSGFSHFAMLNSTKLDQTTTHYVHVPAPEGNPGFARPGGGSGLGMRRGAPGQHPPHAASHLCDWLADALDRVGRPRLRPRAPAGQWHWECITPPVMDNPEKPQMVARVRRGDLTGVLERGPARGGTPGNPYWLAGYGGSLSYILAQTGRWEEAIPPARQALEIVPDDPFLHEHLGFVLTGAGTLDEGEQAIRQAIAIDGDGRPVLQRAG